MKLFSFFAAVALSVNAFALDRKSECVFLSPGSYNPIELMEASCDYIKEGRFDEAAVLYVGGLARALYDIECYSGDVEACRERVTELLWDCSHAVTCNGHRRVAFQKAVLLAMETVRDWDRSTPRDYDSAWGRQYAQLEWTEGSEDERGEFFETFHDSYLKMCHAKNSQNK